MNVPLQVFKEGLRAHLAHEKALLRAQALKDGKRINAQVKVDEYDGFFCLKDLSVWDVDYLLNKKYRIAYRHDLQGNKQYYLVKPRGNESVEHYLLVRQIAEYLKPYFSVWLFHSVRPDIVFEFKNRKIAIEIETGKVLKTNKRSLLEKIEVLNDQYDKDWFFVVTNRDLLKKYRQFGKTYTRKNVLKKLQQYVQSRSKISHTKANPL